MANFCLENRNCFVKLSGKLNLLKNMPEKIEFCFGKLPEKIEILLPGSTTLQISNQIDAAVTLVTMSLLSPGYMTRI